MFKDFKQYAKAPLSDEPQPRHIGNIFALTNRQRTYSSIASLLLQPVARTLGQRVGEKVAEKHSEEAAYAAAFGVGLAVGAVAVLVGATLGRR